MAIQHTNRKIVVDGWIELPMAAQTGVLFRAARKQVDKLLERFLSVGSQAKNPSDTKERYEAVVDGVVRLLTTDDPVN